MKRLKNLSLLFALLCVSVFTANAQLTIEAIFDYNGEPIEGATVTVSNAGDENFSGSTDEHGKFTTGSISYLDNQNIFIEYQTENPIISFQYDIPYDYSGGVETVQCNLTSSDVYQINDTNAYVENNVITTITSPPAGYSLFYFPLKIGNDTVKGIGESTFFNVNIPYIELSTPLERIEANAFQYSNIQKADFSRCTNLKYIDNNAFNSNSLTTLDLSKCTALDTIGDYAFQRGADHIGNIILPQRALSYIGKYAFNNEENEGFELPTPKTGYTHWKDENGIYYAPGSWATQLSTSYSAVQYTPHSSLPDPNSAPLGWKYHNSNNGFYDYINHMIPYEFDNGGTFEYYGMFATSEGVTRVNIADDSDEYIFFPGLDSITTMISNNDISTNIFFCVDSNGFFTKIEISGDTYINPPETLEPAAGGNFSSCAYYYGESPKFYFGSNSGDGIITYEGNGFETPTFVGESIYDINYDGNSGSIKYAFSDKLSDGQSDILSNISGIKHFIATSDFGTFYATETSLYSSGDNNISDKIEGIGKVVDIIPHGNGIYVACEYGVVKNDNGTWTKYDKTNGLPQGVKISCIATSGETLWIGTHGAGLISIMPEINLDLITSPNNLEIGISISNYTTQNSNVDFHIDYGDGNTKDTTAYISDNLRSIDVFNTYEKAGTYKVTVTAKNSEGAIGSTYQYVTVSGGDETCFANFSFTDTYNNGIVTLNDLSGISGATSYSWDMGDGTIYTDSTTSVTHMYTNNQKYTIELTISNPANKCMSTAQKEVQIWSTPQEDPYVNAQFSFTTQENSAGFINSSTGDISGYFWDFGDGFTSQAKNPQHTYKEEGVYTVTLTAFNESVSIASTTTAFVEIKNEVNPNAVSFNHFVVKDITLPIEYNVLFAAEVLGDIDHFFWDFGDGQFLSERYADTITHQYSEPGIYTVTLTVKPYNYMGEDMVFPKYQQQVVVTAPDIVGINELLVAKFQPYVNSNTVSVINNSIIPASITRATLRWDMGDGTFYQEWSPKHTYTKPGVYNITLTLSGPQGTKLINKQTVPVRIAPINEPAFKADFSYYPEGSYLIFTNTSESSADTYSWDFGDRYYHSTDKNPAYEYPKPGYYNVTLRIYDSQTGKMDEVTKQVIVDIAQANIKADFDYFDHGNGYIQFLMDTVTNSNYDVFSWDFDNGYNSNQAHPTHTFAKAGYYDVSLTVKRKADNAMHTVSKHIYVAPTQSPTKGVEDGPVMADFVSSANTASLNAAFEDRSNGTVSSWYWDFGDNSTPATTANPSHTYRESGYYNVCLTVNNYNYQHTNCKTVAVGDITDKHSAFFTYYIDSDNNIIDFDNKSAGRDLTFNWNFGDEGVISLAEHPTHTYTTEGYYAVCLTSKSNSGEIKTYCQDININASDIDTCTYNCVWPGDANNDLKVDHYDVLTIGLNYNMQGPIRVGADANNWCGQNAQPWANYQADSTNNMHGDCNGDGIINSDDIDVVHNFFSYSHSPIPEEFSKAGGEWSLSCEVGPITEAPTKGAATTRTVRTILSGPIDKAADNEIYGLAYELELHGANGLDWNTIKLYFNDVFLSSNPDDLITFYSLDEEKNLIYISVSKTDQQNTPNGGDIGEIVLTFPNGDGESLSVTATSKYGVQSNEQETGTKVPIKGGTFTSIDDFVDIAKTEVSTYPNPNNGSFNIAIKNCKGGELSVEVINIIGQAVYYDQTKVDKGYSVNPIYLDNLPQGVYNVKTTINGEAHLEKIVVQ